jgi:hypothetical protein
MKSDHLPFNSQYVIVTVNRPCIFPRTEDENWLLNPPRRYVMNAQHLPMIADYIESVSDLKGSTFHQPLFAGKSLESARVLIERHRDRGIGDLLFLTGPLNFMQHVSGNNVKIDVYALADRGQVLANHPALHLGTTLHGPLHYDDLGLYNYQWLIETVTECNEEMDQLNVYDALFKQIGFAPEQIDPRFKRPSATLVTEDIQHLDQFYLNAFNIVQRDFRRTPYYVVAPFSAATLRSMNYTNWLEIIRELASRKHVIVIGAATNRIPDMDISAGEFIGKLAQLSNVINTVGRLKNLRVVMGIISKATAIVCLDSGPLYIAQAFRTPAISIWGSHDPGVRLGYDKDYMDLAIWNQPQCRMSPCYAYASFPANKCSFGAHQQCCDVLASTTAEQVMQKLDMVESKNVLQGTFSAAK